MEEGISKVLRAEEVLFFALVSYILKAQLVRIKEAEDEKTQVLGMGNAGMPYDDILYRHQTQIKEDVSYVGLHGKNQLEKDRYLCGRGIVWNGGSQGAGQQRCQEGVYKLCGGCPQS